MYCIVLFYSELSIAVPLANGLTFLFTSVTGQCLGEHPASPRKTRLDTSFFSLLFFQNYKLPEKWGISPVMCTSSCFGRNGCVCPDIWYIQQHRRCSWTFAGMAAEHKTWKSVSYYPTNKFRISNRCWRVYAWIHLPLSSIFCSLSIHLVILAWPNGILMIKIYMASSSLSIGFRQNYFWLSFFCIFLFSIIL